MKKNYFLLILLTVSISSFSQTPDWAWAKKATGTNSDGGSGIVTDKAGNIYITGYFTSDTLAFGNINLVNAGASDIFIAKYSPAGNVIWAKHIGGALNEGANGIAIDGSANIYITGYFVSASISFGSYILTNTDPGDIFIAKYDSAGNAQWAKKAGSLGAGGGNVNSYGIATDASNNVFITGFFTNHVITFGSFNVNNIDTPAADIFVAKYDGSGNALWAKSSGGTGNDYGYGVATDAAGSIYLIGSFSSPSIVVGTTTLTSHGNFDVYFAKYDGFGNPQWAKNPGGTGNEEGYSVATDGPSGNVYITGYFGSPLISFGGSNIGNGGIVNIFVAQYSLSGSGGWAERFGGTGYDYGSSISTDVAGNLLLAGYTASPTIQLGSTILTNAVSGGGSYDIFLSNLQSNTGSPIWAKDAGGDDYDQPSQATVDASGNDYVTGSFRSPACFFGVNSLLKTGPPSTYDLFVAKLNFNTEVNEMANGNSFSVYPNPSRENFSVTFQSQESKIFPLDLIDVTGRIVKQEMIFPNQQNFISISDMVKGIYILRIVDDKGSFTRKLIIE